MLIILDNIRSCHNVGSIFRTADAVGIEKIYLCGITPAPLDKYGRENKRLTKVSLGAEKAVAWERRDSALSVIKELKAQGCKIISLEQSPKSVSIFKAKLAPKKKYALVLGAEVEGLSRAILSQSDMIAEIPMRGKKESLNVAVAFGVAVFLLLR